MQRWMEPWKQFIEAVTAVLAEIASAVEGEHGSAAGNSDVPYRLGTPGILDYAAVGAAYRTNPVCRGRDCEEQLIAVVM